MHFEQFNLACLSQLSYLVGDDGECAIVDPRRDVDLYIEAAEARGLRITHIIETHLHADFVSGHVELARRTGATIHVGHRAGAGYAHEPIHDGDELVLGAVTLRFLETPGHTPESICVLTVEAGRVTRVLTGDTLFIGDVGRPDLVGSKGYTAEQMASFMYDSLRDKLLPLADDVELFPGHGAGSACGRNISKALSCTIGRQRQFNHALQPMSREEFVASMTAGLQPPPAYFPHDAELNRRGAPPLDELPELVALRPEALAAAAAEGAVVLDVRGPDAWSAEHVPGSVCIGLGGNFAAWAGTLLEFEARLLIVAGDAAMAHEAQVRLARVGMHGAAGWLEGGLAAWKAAGRATASLERLAPAAWAARVAAGGAPPLIDVRGPGEWEAGHVPGAVNVPLEGLLDGTGERDRDAPLAVVCQSGYRSALAASLLERAGFGQLVDLSGGTAAWIDAGRPVDVPAGVG